MKEKEVRIGYEIRRLDNAIKKQIGRKLKKEGIDETTVTNGWILKYLYDNREREVYQKDIEKHFNLGRSTVAGIIKMMEEHEFVRRVSVKNDARLKRVLLMPKGEAVHHAIGRAIMDTESQLTDIISPEELETFVYILTKIIRSMDEER